MSKSHILWVNANSFISQKGHDDCHSWWKTGKLFWVTFWKFDWMITERGIGLTEQMSSEEVRIQLTIAKQQGTLLEVHNLRWDDYFNVGFVLGLDASFCLMISIDWDGKINDLLAIRLSTIRYVASGTDYLTTVSEKTKVAHEHHYFDLWQIQSFIDRHPEFTNGPLLEHALTDSYQHQLPVVIGTEKYQGADDFTGMIHELNQINYLNEHDLSSMWTYDIPLKDITYVRMRGTQMHTTKQIMDDVFHQY